MKLVSVLHEILLSNVSLFLPAGDYDPDPKYIVTVKQAFTNRTHLSVRLNLGCDLTVCYASCYIYSGQVNYVQGCKDVHCDEDSGFSDAISAAKSCDLVLYVGGISKTMEGEGNDRASIVLPGKQPDLISQSVPLSWTPSLDNSFISAIFCRLLSIGKPVVVILYHGAPVVTPVYDQVDSLLSVGYTGQGQILLTADMSRLALTCTHLS